MFFNPRFESEIHKKFGLPKIKDNFAEGIVVRPSKNILVPMINNCINSNRINAYISKVGKIDNINTALEDIFLDIIETCLSNENFELYWKNTNDQNKYRIKYEIFEKIEKYFKV